MPLYKQEPCKLLAHGSRRAKN